MQAGEGITSVAMVLLNYRPALLLSIWESAYHHLFYLYLVS
jgi:hypothetical protein